MKNRIVILALGAALALLAASCAGGAAASGAQTGKADFKSVNLPTITSFTLDNGVQVVLKKNPANRLYSLKVAYLGGVAMFPASKGGLESLTLAMMARGSEKYDFPSLEKLAYETSVGISAGMNGYDYSSIDLNTLDKYWDRVFPIFTDIVTKPAFRPEDFAKVQGDARIAAQKKTTDQYEVAVKKLHDVAFAGHVYANDFGGSLETVSAITLDEVRAYYNEKLTADRMVIVAVGNFDEAKLKADLNATFGKLPKKGVKVPEVAPLSLKPGLILEPYPKANGVAHVRGDYPVAPRDSKDYIVQQFANSMLGELLFKIVRTEHGACYSTWANVHGFKATYGSLVVYKTNKPGEVKAWVDEAIAVLASGRTLNVKGLTEDEYAPLAETIEAYKNKFLNGYFDAQQKNSQTAAQILNGIVYFGNPAEYLDFAEDVASITAEDVVRVVTKYMVEGKPTWIVVADQPTLDKVNKDVYATFQKPAK